MPSSVVDTLQQQNAFAAIPGRGEEPMTCNRIYMRQKRPSLSKPMLRGMLDALVALGRAEVVISTPYRYYRLASMREVAEAAVTGYTNPRRCKSSLTEEDDLLLRKLLPLRYGKAVSLWLDLPNPSKKSVGAKRRLVILSPGTSVGLPVQCVLVSILGSGSCLVRADHPTKLADLVLAGMPAKLASELMNKIHRVLEQP